MKKTAWYCGALVLAVLNAVYLALTADSFYLEYVKDEFVYWGYPQWGWMYSDPKIYLWFNVFISGVFAFAVCGRAVPDRKETPENGYGAFAAAVADGGGLPLYADI